MPGVPEAVLARAEAVLGTLEAHHQLPVGSPPPAVEAPAPKPPEARPARKKPTPQRVEPPEAPKKKAGPPSLFDDPDGPPF